MGMRELWAGGGGCFSAPPSSPGGAGGGGAEKKTQYSGLTFLAVSVFKGTASQDHNIKAVFFPFSEREKRGGGQRKYRWSDSFHKEGVS